MMFCNKDGIVEIEKKEWYDQEDVEEFNERFGIGGWKFIEPYCCCLEPSCGYGIPLTKASCRYCDGKCIRPLWKKKSKT